MTEDLQPKSSQVVQISLSDLIDPPWNPRRFFDEFKMRDLIQYILKGGYIPPILLWKGNGQTPWFVISGKRRREAAKRAAKTDIEAIIMDISLTDAKILAVTSNQDDKPYWLGEYVAIRAVMDENPVWSQPEVAAKFGRVKQVISRAYLLTNVLNENSRRIIEQSLAEVDKNLVNQGVDPDPADRNLVSSVGGSKAKSSKPPKRWVLLEDVAFRLTALLNGREQTEAQALGEKCLPVMISKRLNGPQTDELIAWAIGGNDPGLFVEPPKKKKGKATAPKSQSDLSPKGGADGLDLALTEVMTKGFQAHHGGNKTFFKWVGKGLLHAIGWCWGQIWKVFKDSIKAIGQEIGKLLGKTWRLIVRIVLIIALIWAVWTYLVHPSHLYPRGKALVDEVLTVFHGEKANPAPTVPPAPVASLSPVKPNPQRAKRVEQVRPEPPQGVERAKPAVSSLPTANRELPTVVLPWTSDEEPLETYQDELSLVPRLCLLKLNPVIPDAEISVDMAIRRVNDLQDGERYAIFIGRDRHKVLSATPNPTGLTLTFDGGVNLGALAGALSGGLVGGASNNGLQIYWEDLKGIHCNKIQTLSDNLKAIYQIAFVVPGMKKLLIVQCASADDCERLVSALQFWVRTAKKGINSMMSGLPYVNQGVLLGDGNKVDVTWVGSPIDKSGLITGDHIWGVDQNQAKELGRDEIQTALQNLPSGNHTLYSINPGEWNKWKLSLNTRRGNPYNAKLEKVMLIVP